MRRALTPIVTLLPIFLAACGTTESSPDQPDIKDPESEQSWARSDSPCEDSDQETVQEENGNTWCGCGDQPGLYLASEGSSEFSLVSESEDIEVFDLTTDGSGEVYFSGKGGGELDSQVAFSTSADSSGVNVLLDLLLDLSFDNADQFVVGDIAVDGETIVVSDEANGELAVRSDGEWQTESDWTAESEATIEAMVSSESGLSAVGSSAQSDAMVYVESSSSTASDLQFDAVDMSSEGATKLNGMASSSFQQTFFTAGEADGSALLSTCSSGCNEASSWSQIDLSAYIDGASSANDVSFSSQGTYGIVAGETASAEGFALVTADGGASWTPLSGDMEKLDSCAIDDDGNYTLAGEAGFFAEGTVNSSS